ncbi:ESS family glutamate:Na+ symporter [Peptoniphilus stercorisuis]|uniref:Sodium/glutamate symporter n=1 Tax=Peptoniphilus stercorisuis TaxID=1436965 RepID=A0ABS4KCG5_9FIRM|nr:sodium/glutamate symporter [Peptoniphilus stercorisuis]MBP2025442.1 ESS family glutamate:Na+ symporter [Peptoniphilus stercorisuis]
MIIKPDMMQTAAICIVVLFIGKWIKGKVDFFEKFCIPAPVIGGFLFAIIHLFLREFGILEFQMDVTFQDPFMMFFFTSIGLIASIDIIKKGGVGVIIFYIATVILVFLQNGVGIGIAKFLGEDSLLGLLCGSITMVGGHGTAGVWGPEFVKNGFVGANEIGMAAATFGLIMGSLIGGPIGGRLIKKNNLAPSVLDKEENIRYKEEELINTVVEEINVNEILKTMAVIFVSIAIGVILKNELLKLWQKLILPAYVTSMLIAGIYRNTIGRKGTFKVNERCANLLGDIGLNMFLAMALTNLKLWQLAEVAGPMIIILLVQTLIIVLYTTFVTFNIMGRDYDAAVLSAGMCGFGMGATANGVANMSSVVEKYGPAPKAFFILPIVGAFLIDLTNTFAITFFASLF